MRILKLTLKNFRSHRETVLELDRFNFVRGPNGCGKSSVQMALEYLLTGRCRVRDAAGRGAEALIRAGAKELEVSATLEGGETICRRRTPRSQVVELNGKRVPVDAAEDSLEKRFGSADVLSAVLNASRFFEMSETDQKRLLAQMVDTGKLDIPAEIANALHAINEELPRLTSVGDFEAVHKRFYDLRADASRSLNALSKMEMPETPLDLPPVQEVKKELEDLRQQKERFITQKREANASWESAQLRLKQLEAEIEAVSSEILSLSQEQELVQLESQRKHAEKLRQESADLIAEQRTAEKFLVALEGLKGRCPNCRQPISEEVRTTEMEAVRERVAELEGRIQGIREELSECAGIEAASARLKEHCTAIGRRAKLNEEQCKLLKVERPISGDLESRITIVAQRLSKGERVLERVNEIEKAKVRWEASIGEKSALEKKIGLLDRLTEFFGPAGALMAQARARIGSFAEDLNRHLAVFGYTCNLGLDPLEIHVGRSKDDRFRLLLNHLSESELFRFSLTFQIALAMMTGLRFVVIDRADLLDRGTRRMLTGLLLNSGLDQAIVLATSEEATPSIVVNDVKFFRLADWIKEDEAPVPTAAYPGLCGTRGTLVR